jgi:DNA-binding MurR/RpiR family transcriptional regulator
VDFRRYEQRLASLARKVVETRNVRIVLMTDKWISPIAKHAHEVIPVPIESGTLWGTYSAALAVTEAIVTQIAEHDWDKARARIEAWEKLRPPSKDDLT